MATCKDCLHQCYTEELADVEQICNFFLDKAKYKLVRHGRWELKNTCGPHTGKLHCSACGKIPKSLCVERYCPNCGAPMDL